jgi:hypothetical protein
VITFATAQGDTQPIRHEAEPTRTMPATPRRRPAAGPPSRAVTVALVVLIVLLLAGVFAAGSL